MQKTACEIYLAHKYQISQNVIRLVVLRSSAVVVNYRTIIWIIRIDVICFATFSVFGTL